MSLFTLKRFLKASVAPVGGLVALSGTGVFVVVGHVTFILLALHVTVGLVVGDGWLYSVTDNKI
jgi:membrane protein DedA with SNARE-associated domain